MVGDHAPTRCAAGPAWCLPLILLLAAGPAWAADSGPSGKQKVSYSRDIRPLLANSCYACHGPDAGKRQAGLRLDVREVAVAAGDRARQGGQEPAGRADHQRRSRRADAAAGARSGRGCRRPAVALMRRWIDEGAKYEPHWAYVPPAAAAAARGRSKTTGRGTRSTISSPPATKRRACGRRRRPIRGRSCGACAST